MIKRVLIYGIVIGITWSLFFLFPEKIIGLALIMECIYFVIAFVAVQFMAGKLDFSMEHGAATAEKNKKVPIQITVRNKSRLFYIPFQLRVIVTNYFTGEENVCKLHAVIQAGKCEKISTEFISKNCGDIDIQCEYVLVYDWLYIFKRKRKLKLTKKVEILPECHLIMTEITRVTREFVTDSELYSDSEKGDDLSEIYQIREYKEGDSIHDIHWKLSAKNDELLLKEHAKPLGCVVLIWIDLCNRQMIKKNRREKRRVGKQNHVPITSIEIAASLSLSLVEERCVHMVAWYEEKNQRIVKKRICDEENIYELLNRLLYLETYSDREKADFYWNDTFHKSDFSSVVEVSLDGTVIVNGNNIEIKKKDNEICWNEIYLVV